MEKKEAQKSKEVAEVVDIISKDLSLDPKEAVHLDAVDIVSLHKQLVLIVQHLLDHDFSRLINACYRLDLSQKIFEETLALSKPEEVAAALTTAILKRVEAKAFWRRKYKGC